VKADGYGHGAIQTALHLADYCGADAFAVATVDEGIKLRKALRSERSVTGVNSNVNLNVNFNSNANVNVNFNVNATAVPVVSIPVVGSGSGTGHNDSVVNGNVHGNGNVNGHGSQNDNNGIVGGGLSKMGTITNSNNNLFQPPPDIVNCDAASSSSIGSTITTPIPTTTTAAHPHPHPLPPMVPKMPPPPAASASASAAAMAMKAQRSPNIRILVLGPPTNLPDDFNLYHQFNLELMISGPNMARALMEWVSDEASRRIAEVEKSAMDQKSMLMKDWHENTFEFMNQEEKDATLAKLKRPTHHTSNGHGHGQESGYGYGYGGQNSNGGGGGGGHNKAACQASTLSNVEGAELCKELKAILKKKEQLERAAASAAITLNTSMTTNNTVAATTAKLEATKVSNGNSNGNGNSNSNGNGDASSISIAAGSTESSSSSSIRGNDGIKTKPVAKGSGAAVAVAVAVAAPFKGIEDVAKVSRAREKAAAKILADATGEGDDDDDDDDDDDEHEIDRGDDNSDGMSSSASNELECRSDGSRSGQVANPSTSTRSRSRRRSSSVSASVEHMNTNDASDTAVVSNVSSAAVKNAAATVVRPDLKKGVVPATARRKLRWHALVDSGMGRLGFKSVEDEDDDENGNVDNDDGDDHAVVVDPNLPAPLLAHTKKKLAKWKVGPHRDTVSIIKAMSDAEIHGGSPIEFYGMCTHMAEASANSNYTNEQMSRFKSLLKRVREADIFVPTISTDNSSALLTSNLNHFNPDELLSQPNVTNTLGFVRTGGGIFGQRPAFTQLRPVSTLTASVRHVAIVQEGQSVGYDRAYVAPRNVRIATLTIGFADGYPRDLGNGRGKISIRGELFPVAGNVCMDMLMVDLGPAEEIDTVGSQVAVGDRAILWGPENDSDEEGSILLQDLSQTLGTTQSALTCGLNKSRVQREYVS